MDVLVRKAAALFPVAALVVFVSLPAGACLVARAAGGTAEAPEAAGADAITADQMRSYLGFVASDAVEGRDTPSRGLDITAQFLAALLERSDLRPGAPDGTFLQKIQMTRRTVDPEAAAVTVAGRPFALGDDYLANLTAGRANGGVVYVGHGFVVESRDVDAYRGLEIDLTGRILVAHVGLPRGVVRNDVRGTPGETFETPVSYAARHGAAGVILVPDFETLASWNSLAADRLERGRLVLEDASSSDGSTVPSIIASATLLDALFAGERLTGAEILRRALTNDPAAPFALSGGKTVELEIGVNTGTITTQNVVAILEGSDPELRDEYVAIGAHYDHVGRDPDAPGADQIFNGADDDGSGTVAVLSMAEAFARRVPGPRRSLLFVWHAGEERGLLGSEYVTTHPPVPIDRIVAQFNVDMIGRSRAPDDTNVANTELTGPNEVYVIGSRMMSTELGDLVEGVNDEYLDLAFNYKYDDPDDPNRFFLRSDHYNYAKHGIPIVFYFSGVHEDYHQVTDSIEKIDFEKLERVARTIYATAAAVADRDQRPVVDKALPEQLLTP